MRKSPHCVAVVDDDDLVRDFFIAVLEEEGYTCRPFSCGLDALADVATSEEPPDLILCDIQMPGMTGIELLESLRLANCCIPVILVSGQYDLPCAMDALGNGAGDYLLKPALPEDILAAVGRYLRPRKIDPTRKDAPAGGVSACSEALSTAFSMDLCNMALSHLTSRRDGSQLMALISSLSQRRIETLEHSRRVASYSVLTGLRLGNRLGVLDLQELEIGAMLHDIGKVGVPENVLNKTGPLNADEWRIMKLHTALGRDLLRPISGMHGVAEMVYSHHESFDGKGYPRGLAGDRIVPCARVFAVADTFDAITSERPYRRAQTTAAARVEILRMSGSQFDPVVVEQFLEIPEAEIDSIRRLHSEPPDFEPPFLSKAFHKGVWDSFDQADLAVNSWLESLS